MSNTPTEAHRKLATDLCRNATGSNRALHHVPKFAQLIADSEARAIAKQVEALAILTLRWDKLEKERDQLRAEVKRLKLDDKAKALMLKVCNNEKARAARAEAAETVALARWNGALERAMKAEAELAAEQENCDAAYDELRADCDELRADVVRLTKQAVFDGDHIHTLNAAFATRAEVTDANARAERAEAAETVALSKWNGALERALKAEADLATERARLDSGTILLIVAGERVWHCGVDLRAAIDAGMQEDAQ